MKKSECYKIAMLAVIDDEALENDVKLEIIEVLMTDKKSAEWSEEHEGCVKEA